MSIMICIIGIILNIYISNALSYIIIEIIDNITEYNYLISIIWCICVYLLYYHVIIHHKYILTNINILYIL